MFARHPLILPLVGVATGAAAGAQYLRFLPGWAPALFLVCLVCAFLVRNRHVFAFALFLFFFSYGNLSLKPLLMPKFPPYHIVNRVDEERLIMEGIIAERPFRKGDGARMVMTVTGVKGENGIAAATGRLMIYAREGTFPFQTGDRVRLMGKVRKPRPLGLPGEFDYARFLAFQDIFATVALENTDEVMLIRGAESFPVQRAIDRLSLAASRVIGTAVPGTEGEILKAMLTGERGGIPVELEDAYSRAGVSHILSISGFHIGVVALCIFQLLYFLARRSRFLLLHANVRRLVPLLTLPPIILYLLVSGGAAATLRSVLMAAACTVSLYFDRETDPLNPLILAALAILAWAPQTLYDVSFQLSFLALWGIILVLPVIEGPVAHIRSVPLRWLVTLIVSSGAAILATLVPVAFHFQQASWAGIVSNLLVVPLLGYGAVVVGFAGLLVSPLFSPLGAAMLKGAALLVAGGNWAIIRFADLPVVHWSPLPGTLVVALLVMAIISFARSRKLALSAIVGIVSVWLTMSVADVLAARNELRVTFLSLGQSESTLINLPDGRTMLIDGGGRPDGAGDDFGKRYLEPALRRVGVRRIDCMVLTHPHPDHLQGLTRIADVFPVGEFWRADTHRENIFLAKLEKVLVGKKVRILRFDAQSSPRDFGGCRFEFLAPFKPPVDDDNEDSLVFRMSASGGSVLFTGDIGFATEQHLLKRPGLLAAEILKVPHHGSRYSSSPEFIKAVASRDVLISAGYGNRFGLPAAETLGRLEKSGAHIHRTDLDGTITAIYRHDKWEFLEYNY